ncbi:carbohydrate-binding module family 20 domain-containing protein [Streptomyces sp. NPDC048349]|uniref:carbohydrate-binding module family 20 domain-containing protein n=1 Tax=Streptomyces sp. NPDC048349 TaxID=3155486 RepID=UPI003437D809
MCAPAVAEEPHPRAVVSFDVAAPTQWGDTVFVTGSTPELGSWSPEAAVLMSSASSPHWTASLVLDGATSVSFKYLIKKADGSVVWERANNRALQTPSDGSSFTTHDRFRDADVTPASGIAPDCAVAYASWRYTIVVNQCGSPLPLQTLHQSGTASHCRWVEAGASATFPGYGLVRDDVLAVNHC